MGTHAVTVSLPLEVHAICMTKLMIEPAAIIMNAPTAQGSNFRFAKYIYE
jgi:hypothetical protein